MSERTRRGKLAPPRMRMRSRKRMRIQTCRECAGAGVGRSLRLDVVAEQQVLVAQVELPVGDYRVGPGGLSRAVGLHEAAALEVLLVARLDQEHGAVLDAVVEPLVRQGDGSLGRAAFFALVPELVAGLEV